MDKYKERTPFGARMHEARMRSKLSQKVVCERIGCSQGTLSELERLYEGSALTPQFADLYRVNPKWLATGKGEMEPSKSVANTNGNEVLIQQFDAAGAMGNGLVLHDQAGVIESWKVSREWVSKNVKSHSGIGNLCIVTGFGNSMDPMFKSGDPLLIDTGVKSVDFDGTYFFRIGKDGFIKHLQRVPGDGIRAISENKGYDSWTIKEDMDFEVFGRVLKVWRSQDL